MKIPVLIPSVPTFGHIEKYLKKIDITRRYSNFGPLEYELRCRLSEYLGCRPENVATASNATVAITGGLQTSGFADEEWFLPSWTFAATAAAAQSIRQKYFVDVDSSWRGRFESNHEFVIDVLPFGDSLVGDRYSGKKAAVVDAAASVANLEGVFSKCSGNNVFVVVSMHATKLIPAGEGAFVFSPNTEWISSFQRWTNFGFDENRIATFAGTNAKLSEYSAAVGLASLDSRYRVFDDYRSLTDRALEISSNFDFLCHPAMSNRLITPYWIVTASSTHQKQTLVKRAKNLGIEVRDWWQKGCHRMPPFKDWPAMPLPNTERLGDLTLGLPFHAYLEEADLSLLSNLLEDST